MAKAGLKKISVVINGHGTSVALEPEFWAVIDEMARAVGEPRSSVLESLDISRGDKSLASHCRLAALKYEQVKAQPKRRAA